MIHPSSFWLIVIILFALIILRYKYQTLVLREDFLNLDTGLTHKLKVKTAIDKKMGLMHRKEPLREDTGLLFDYGRYGIFTFWMKNTFIPLEIICLDHNYKVIGIIHDMKPKSKKTRTLDKPFRYAIEVNNGYTNDKNIKPGDTLELEYIQDL